MGAGALSAEGSRAAAAVQELRFRTYGPLDVVWHGCPMNDQCRTGFPWIIWFNNPLDTAASATPRLRIEPALPEMTVRIAVRATNAELTQGQGRRVTVPANDRVEVRFQECRRG